MSGISKHRSTSTLLQEHFTDAGDLGRLMGFEMDFRQLDAGPQEIPAILIQGSNVAVLEMRFNRGYHQRLFIPSGLVGIGIPEQGVADWFNTPYPGGAVMPFNQPSGIDTVSTNSFKAYAIAVQQHYLEEISRLHQIPISDVICTPSSGEFIQASPETRNLRALLRTLFRQTVPSLNESSESTVAVELLIAAVKSSTAIDKSTAAVRDRALKKVLEYIHTHRRESLSVAYVCSETNVAYRTLVRAFNERFGVSPKTYLHCVRLSAVRTQLLARQEGALISDVANAHGFWHMGQFAKDYFNLFGELPSSTLSWKS